MLLGKRDPLVSVNLLRIAAVNQNPQEMQHIVQIRQHPPESRTVLHGHFIRAGRNCRAGIHLLATAPLTPPRRIGTPRRQFPNGNLDGMAKETTVNRQVADGIVFRLVFASEKQFHSLMLLELHQRIAVRQPEMVIAKRPRHRQYRGRSLNEL